MAAGDYGTGLDLGLLLQLVPGLSQGVPLDTTRDLLNTQQDQMGNIMDYVNLLFDPNFAMLSGTADPLTLGGGAAMFPPTPTIDRYAASGIPVVSLIANGIKAGQYDLLQAQGMLREAIGNGEVTGFTPEMGDAAVQSMWDEQTRAEADYLTAQASGGGAASNDPYAKAFLPSPLETYQPTTEGPYSVPTTEAYQGRVQGADAKKAAADKALAEYDANKTYQRPDRYDPTLVTEKPAPSNNLRDYVPPPPPGEWAISGDYVPEPDLAQKLSGNYPHVSKIDPSWKPVQPTAEQLSGDYVPEPDLMKKLSGDWKPPPTLDTTTLAAPAAPSYDAARGQLEGDVRAARYDQQVNDLALQFLAQLKTNANQTPLTDTLRQRAQVARLMGLL